jgi:hypothetical protein
MPIKSIFHPDRKSKTIGHSHFGDMWDSLPDRAKNYIAEIEQRCDPTGEVQMIASLTEQRDALVQKNLELKEMLREFMMRNQCAFPENDADIFWWHSGLKPDLMIKFFEAAGFGDDQEIPGYPIAIHAQ